MLYRKFGKTGQMVSALGFGCMRLPVVDNNYAEIDKPEAVRMIRYAIDNGVNYVDTAYPYHGDGSENGGNSELLVAEALRDGYRKKVFLATKLPCWLVKNQSDMDRYLDMQLRRLQTDSIDFYLAHSLNKTYWENLKRNGIDKFMDKAVADGRIKYAGFSFHDSINLFREVVDYYDWSFCQIQYNYLDESFQAGTNGLKYAASKGLGVAVMEPLRGGRLASVPAEVDKVFSDSGVKRSAAGWGYSWVLNHPEVSVVLSGMNNMQQVQENIETAAAFAPEMLSARELSAVAAARDIFKRNIKVHCTGCEYCMPCPHGVDIPMNFAYYNDYSVLGCGTYGRDYKDLFAETERATRCVSCGACEKCCPQGIAIREKLKEVAAVFEH